MYSWVDSKTEKLMKTNHRSGGEGQVVPTVRVSLSPSTATAHFGPTSIIGLRVRQQTTMVLGEAGAHTIFAAYFVAIFVTFGFVIKSIISDISGSRLVEGRPFLFLRLAFGALLCTWYCKSLEL